MDSHYLRESGSLSTSLARPAGLILAKSSAPGRGEGAAGFYATGTVTGEILYADENVETRTGTTGRLFVDIAQDLFLDERVSVWAGYDENPPHYFSPFHRGNEEGRHFYVDWGYLRWNGSPVSVQFGRLPQVWGPGRFTQLLISDNSPPLDMLKLNVSLFEDRLNFTGFTSTIDSDSGTYLVAHRLDILPLENLRIGLSETILFKSEGLDFAYMNPVVPWYPIQWNEREDDNAFIAIDATWQPFAGFEAYGELLIDDMQYQTQYDRPNKLGLTAGLSGYLRSIGTGGVLEYSRVDRYVYSQRRKCNYYLHHGEIIGSGLGPDSDRITFSAGTSAAWPVLAEVTLDHTRSGEGTVQEGWPDSVTTGGKFPSGTVEHTTGARLHMGFYPTDFLEVHAAVSKDWVRNTNHVSGETSSDVSAFLQATFKW
mgnify:FL=1